MGVPTTVRAALLLVLLTATGCGGGASRPARAPVTGRVVTTDGKPCDGALVVFHASEAARTKDAKPVATTADDGSFRLTTYESGDGAVPGAYGVTVVWPPKAKAAAFSLSGEGSSGGGDRLGGRYGNPASPRVSVEVPRDGLADLVIEVE